MATLRDALPKSLLADWWPDCEALDVDAIAGTLRTGDVILVKASNRLFWKSGSVAALVAALEAKGSGES